MTGAAALVPNYAGVHLLVKMVISILIYPRGRFSTVVPPPIGSSLPLLNLDLGLLRPPPVISPLLHQPREPRRYRKKEHVAPGALDAPHLVSHSQREGESERDG